jgi:hypothetical protein
MPALNVAVLPKVAVVVTLNAVAESVLETITPPVKVWSPVKVPAAEYMPRFVRAVEVLLRSERLLATLSHVELASVAVSASPRFEKIVVVERHVAPPTDERLFTSPVAVHADPAYPETVPLAPNNPKALVTLVTLRLVVVTMPLKTDEAKELIPPVCVIAPPNVPVVETLRTFAERRVCTVVD